MANMDILPMVSNMANERVSRGGVNELGQFVLSCEKCGMKFQLDTDPEPAEMLPARNAEPSSDACLAVSNYKGGPIMELSPAWFDLKMQ